MIMIIIMVRDAIGLSNLSTVKWIEDEFKVRSTESTSCLMLCCTVITWNWLADRDKGFNNDHGSL